MPPILQKLLYSSKGMTSLYMNPKRKKFGSDCSRKLCYMYQKLDTRHNPDLYQNHDAMLQQAAALDVLVMCFNTLLRAAKILIRIYDIFTATISATCTHTQLSIWPLYHSSICCQKIFTTLSRVADNGAQNYPAAEAVYL